MPSTTTILAITLCLLGAAFADSFNDIPSRLQGASPDAIKQILKILNRGESTKNKRSDTDQIFKNYLTGSNNNFGFFNDVTVLRAKELREQLKALLGNTDSLDITRVNPIETVMSTLPIVQQVEFIQKIFAGSLGTVAFADDSQICDIFRFHPVHYVIDKSAEFSKVQHFTGSITNLHELIFNASSSSFIVSYNSSMDISVKIERKATLPVTLGALGTLTPTADRFFGDFSSTGFDLSDATSNVFRTSSRVMPVEMSIISPVFDFSVVPEGFELALFKYNTKAYIFERVFAFYDVASSRLFHSFTGFSNQPFGSYAFAIVKKAEIPVEEKI